MCCKLVSGSLSQEIMASLLAIIHSQLIFALRSIGVNSLVLDNIIYFLKCRSIILLLFIIQIFNLDLIYL